MSIAELHAVRPLDSAETTQLCLSLAHIANKLYSSHAPGLTNSALASVCSERALSSSAYTQM
jgi:hypothetical protein